ncbi:DoxX family protein [Mucilaginibacter myungsuensis]|uniref:DoxX family protein n=1 Tax=Mucilaginibacter myungsuensis TaxID=649104 RepID=A0A929L0H1_9SPHI|nr:DoxX family protein [Mucilaginibacter myungsuensis]MBE9663985.1 DoxX family protein [Mucilaginibacter myungsuensis]MDN3601164.1 DoxX family protein [Mucilaginibacter myungsuensis]
MSPKAIKNLYWVLLVILCLFLAVDGIGGITMQKQGVEALNHIGYPTYLMPLFGILKILAIIALIQNRYPTLKEWAFAGIAFTFIGAAHAHIMVKDPIGTTLFPVIFLVYLIVIYILWNKYKKNENIA